MARKEGSDPRDEQNLFLFRGEERRAGAEGTEEEDAMEGLVGMMGYAISLGAMFMRVRVVGMRRRGRGVTPGAQSARGIVEAAQNRLMAWVGLIATLTAVASAKRPYANLGKVLSSVVLSISALVTAYLSTAYSAPAASTS
jgi:Uncharacterised protein family (UPF0139)